MLAQGAITGRASPQEVRNAADSLFQHCVLNRGVGGIAEDIGKQGFYLAEHDHSKTPSQQPLSNSRG